VNLAGFWRALALLERDDDPADDRTTLERAKAYVDSRVYRADVVASLPASAPPGYLLVTAGDPNLYVGTGSGLRKIPTQAV
jgi:hypothetical protein